MVSGNEKFRLFFLGTAVVICFALLSFYQLIPQPTVVTGTSQVLPQIWQIPSMPDTDLRLQAFENVVAALRANSRQVDTKQAMVPPGCIIRGVISDGGTAYALVEKQGQVQQVAVGEEVMAGVRLQGIAEDRVILSDGRKESAVFFFCDTPDQSQFHGISTGP